MNKFHLEFIFHAHNTSVKEIENALREFCDQLVVVEDPQGEEKGTHYKITLTTEDPTMVFDVCAQAGRIRTVKIDEV